MHRRADPLIGEADGEARTPPRPPVSQSRSPRLSADLRDALAHLHPQAFAWAVRCCEGDRAEAEDVLHLAYCKVLDERARFDGRSALATWFLGVVRRTAQEEARWRWMSAARLERWWRGRTDDDAPRGNGQLRDADDRVVALQSALGQLSRRQQEVLHLVFYQEMTIQQAADVLALPVGTARTHYERGKARLRTLLTTEDAR